MAGNELKIWEDTITPKSPSGLLIGQTWSGDKDKNTYKMTPDPSFKITFSGDPIWNDEKESIFFVFAAIASGDSDGGLGNEFTTGNEVFDVSRARFKYFSDLLMSTAGDKSNEIVIDVSTFEKTPDGSAYIQPNTNYIWYISAGNYDTGVKESGPIAAGFKINISTPVVSPMVMAYSPIPKMNTQRVRVNNSQMDMSFLLSGVADAGDTIPNQIIFMHRADITKISNIQDQTVTTTFIKKTQPSAPVPSPTMARFTDDDSNEAVSGAYYIEAYQFKSGSDSSDTNSSDEDWELIDSIGTVSTSGFYYDFAVIPQWTVNAFEDSTADKNYTLFNKPDKRLKWHVYTINASGDFDSKFYLRIDSKADTDTVIHLDNKFLDEVVRNSNLQKKFYVKAGEMITGRQRLALDIGNIIPVQETYEKSGTMISYPFFSDDPLYAFTLESIEDLTFVEQLELNGEPPERFIRYFLQFSDGGDWSRISPLQRINELWGGRSETGDTRWGSDPEVNTTFVPKKIILDSFLSEEERDRDSKLNGIRFINLSFPVRQVRIKIEKDVSTLTDTVDGQGKYTPRILSYKINSIKRNILLQQALEETAII